MCCIFIYLFIFSSCDASALAGYHAPRLCSSLLCTVYNPSRRGTAAEVDPENPGEDLLLITEWKSPENIAELRFKEEDELKKLYDLYRGICTAWLSS